jgi:ankyrin repeat protein
LEKFRSKPLPIRFVACPLYQKKLLVFLNGVDNEGNTPLCLASKRRNDGARICEYLIHKNLQIIFPLNEENINAQQDGMRRRRTFFYHRNYDGDTPIALACTNKNPHCVKLWMSKYVVCNSEVKAVSAEQFWNQIHDFVSSKNKNGLTTILG